MKDSEPKKQRELTISKAVETIRMIDADEARAVAEACAKAEGRVRRAHAKFRQTVLSKVHPSAVAIVLKEAGREVPACFVPSDSDVPPMTADEIDEAVSEIPARLREPLPESRLNVGRGR